MFVEIRGLHDPGKSRIDKSLLILTAILKNGGDVGGTWVGGNIPTPPDMVVKWGIDFFVKSIVHFCKMQKIS